MTGPARLLAPFRGEEVCTIRQILLVHTSRLVWTDVRDVFGMSVRAREADQE
ncbi:hypothetical protein SAMN04488074_113166 [Lentzea albidocapillata subsp. violacea]|uniref:Uncharacterized protein n=1 Tax=Lentzea albidocapillata subsp. violacea TaxID=128104 RepID=A0A1G9MXH2_9PSEU|nr:hypothetical protein SAMN04488074_113166 [Lentzea albidocapillata subsp. violacea]